MIGTVGDLDGTLDGYLVDQVMSARDALEPLSRLFAFEAGESGDVFRFVRRGRRPHQTFTTDDLVEEGRQPLVSIKRAQETELPAEIAIGFADVLADYRASSVNSRRLVVGSRRLASYGSGAVLTSAAAGGLADMLLQDLWAGRETVALALPPSALNAGAGGYLHARPRHRRHAHAARHPDRGCRRKAHRGAHRRSGHSGDGAGRDARLAAAVGRAPTARRRCCCSTCR